MPIPRLRKAVCGFTLIEIAVVLFIVGLLLTSIVAFVNAVVANRQIEATRINLKTAVAHWRV